MSRKRRHPTPYFRIPPPYQPITGEHADLTPVGEHPHCAMMQVAATDTKADYLICRGYDPYTKRFIEYEVGNSAKPGIPVAKPYGSRVAGSYSVGQMFPAVMPLTKIGQTPGVAATTQGHPANLDEDVEILYTDDNLVVQWLLLDSGGSGAGLRDFELKTGQSLSPGGTATALVLEWTGSEWDTVTDSDFTVRDMMSKFRQSSPPSGQSGARGVAHLHGDQWVILQMEHQAEKIHCQVNDASGFTVTDASVAIDGVIYYNGYTPTTAPTTAYNPSKSGSEYMYYGADDDHMDCWYDWTNDKYWINPVEC